MISLAFFIATGTPKTVRITGKREMRPAAKEEATPSIAVDIIEKSIMRHPLSIYIHVLIT
jgi:hypothetical protein